MTYLDDELRRVLSRREPPPGFADRVLGRAGQAQPQQKPEPRRPVWRWAAAAALVGALGGGIQYYTVMEQRAERVRGEAAKEQVLKALRLAGSKLQVVQETVKGIGS
jgi:hypothetical protein